MPEKDYATRWLKSTLIDKVHNRQQLEMIWHSPSIRLEIVPTTYRSHFLALKPFPDKIYIFEIVDGTISYTVGYQTTVAALTGKQVELKTQEIQQIEQTQQFIQGFLNHSIWKF